MRILTTATMLSPQGGIELSTLQDATALLERGHQIELLYGCDGPQHALYTRLGATVSGPFPFHFDFHRPAHSLRSFGPAITAVRAIRPDVLWLNRPEHVVWAQTVSRLAGGIPVLCQLHHAPNFHRVRQLYAGIRGFAAVSEFTKRQWVERGLAPERVTVIHNAVPPSDYPFGSRAERGMARHDLGLPQGAPIALFCGRFTAEKGVFTLLAAWRRVLERRSDAVLVLLGGAPPEGERALAEALRGLPPGSWRRFPFQADTVPFLHASDLVVVPSQVSEAFGRIVIEALSTGRPVVASRIGGIPEILQGPFARCLFTSEDAHGLAARIEEVLTWAGGDPGLGKRCASWVEQRFSYPRHVDRLESFLMHGSARRDPSRLAAAGHG